MKVCGGKRKEALAVPQGHGISVQERRKNKFIKYALYLPNRGIRLIENKRQAFNCCMDNFNNNVRVAERKL